MHFSRAWLFDISHARTIHWYWPIMRITGSVLVHDSLRRSERSERSRCTQTILLYFKQDVHIYMYILSSTYTYGLTTILILLIIFCRERERCLII
jgi:hypothetical protein